MKQPQLGDFICFSLYSANHAMNRIYKPLLAPLGLTYPQYLTMVALWEKDDQSVGEIGETLQLETNTLTPLLKRLEANGHIERKRSKSDERQVIVSLTKAGRELQAQSHDIAQCVFSATGLREDELIELQSKIALLAAKLRTS